MRKSLVLLAAFLVLPLFADADTSTTTASGATVTYASSTPVCPANSMLTGTMCYCFVGYSISGNQCVKNAAPAPAAGEIYEDIFAQAGVNDELSCAQMGITVQPDLDMCQKYKAASADQRAQFKTIQRPSTAHATISNPWAPAGQQTFANTGTSSPQGIPANLPPPPPPPPAPPPAPVPEPAPEPQPPQTPKIESTPTVGDEPVARKVAAVQPEPIQEKTEASPQPVQPVTPVQSQTAAAAAAEIPVVPISTSTEDAVQISDSTSGLSPLANLELATIPENKPETHAPSFFARVFNWLFGWL